MRSGEALLLWIPPFDGTFDGKKLPTNSDEVVLTSERLLVAERNEPSPLRQIPIHPALSFELEALERVRYVYEGFGSHLLRIEVHEYPHEIQGVLLHRRDALRWLDGLRRVVPQIVVEAPPPPARGEGLAFRLLVGMIVVPFALILVAYVGTEAWLAFR